MQVREVICPSCSHRFMWMDVEEGPTIKKYRSVETGETFHTAVCPQGGKRVILLPDRIRAVLPGTEDNLDWLAERETFYPVEIHTANPVGRANMERILARYWGEQYW